MTKSIKHMFMLLVAVMGITFTACSNDDEPQTDAAKEQVEFIKSMVLNENGEILFMPTDTEGVYVCPMNNAANSRNLCESMLNTSWKGESLCVDLGNHGVITGKNSDEEGVFDELHFNIKELPKFTLKVASEDYCDNENFPNRTYLEVWLCRNCGKIYAVQQSQCPFCKSTNREKVLR